MTQWSQPIQLVTLAQFYEKAEKNPDAFSDEEFIENINKAFWPADCWSFVQASFAIIAPGCSMRPHLTKELIKRPIGAMIAGGLEDPSDVIAQGVVCATNEKPYVEPTDDGKRWLLNEWPQLEDMVKEAFQELWDENCSEEQNG